MATGPHNAGAAAAPFPGLPSLPDMHLLPPVTLGLGLGAPAPLPRLGGEGLFLRPPAHSAPATTVASPPAGLLSGLMPPLGLVPPLSAQLDPSAAAAAAAAAMAAAGGKLSPAGSPAAYPPGADYPNAAAAAAAAMQATLKMGRPPGPYDKPLPGGLFFSAPPLGMRADPGLVPPFPACPTAKLPSPVLPHAAGRAPAKPAPPTPTAAAASNGDARQPDRDDADAEKRRDEEAEASPPGEEGGDGAAGVPRPGANNNNGPAKLVSKGFEFSFDDKSQTESEVQKLMSIALSNNQKRLEKACLNAIDKPAAPAGPGAGEERPVDDERPAEPAGPHDDATAEERPEAAPAGEPDGAQARQDEEADGAPTPAQPEAPVDTDADADVCEDPGRPAPAPAPAPDEEKQTEAKEPDEHAGEEMERPNESGRASVESDESMTSSNVEMLVANAMPDKEGLFFCHLCDFTGNTRMEFQDHMNWHYDFRCPKCDYTSRTEGRLNRHIRDFHSEVPPQNFSGKVTRVNKPKTHKCKQCSYVALTKTDFWAHSRTHIKDDKILECPKCDFVTEYKHHLEYHIRNHFGSKPYKCEKCNYECVNKSMLNSHMKSHTNVYQYRCADCQYATKYCHSLKLHLGKYQHRPATILNSDGSLPEYDNSSDILSIKRGPPRGSRMQRLAGEVGPGAGQAGGAPSPLDASPGAGPLPFLHAPGPMAGFWPPLPVAHQAGLFLPPGLLPPPGPPGPLPFLGADERPGLGLVATGHGDEPPELRCNFCEQPAESREALVRHMLARHKDENKDLLGASLLSGFAPDPGAPGLADAGPDALDLRAKKASDSENALHNFFKRSIAQAIGAAPAPDDDEDEAPEAKRRCEPASPGAPGAAPAAGAGEPSGRKRPRKSRAFRLDELPVKKEEEEEAGAGMDESGDSSAPLALEAAERELDALARSQECQHCSILFRDRTMFEMHMGYHGYGNPFKCNRCGHVSQDRVQFFIHLCQMAHS